MSRAASATHAIGPTTINTSSKAKGTRFDREVTPRCNSGYTPVEYHRSTMSGGSGSSSAAAHAMATMDRIQTALGVTFSLVQSRIQCYKPLYINSLPSYKRGDAMSF